MNEAAAGGISGIIMSQVFIVVGALMLLSLSKDPPGWLRKVLGENSWVILTVPLSFASIATWGLVGVVTGILYGVSLEHASGGGLGSDNLVYTLGIILVSVALVAPWLILLRRLFNHLVITTLAFIGIFGWFLPYLSS